MSKENTRQILLLITIITSIILLCFLVYGEVLGYYFTSIDAFPLLLTGKIDLINDIYKIVTSPLGGGFPFGAYYRPVSQLSYGIDYLVWGKNPMGYHLTNILLHLANSIMVFLIAGILFQNYKKGLLYAWASAVLFMLSPLSAAVVPSIARRQDMLAAFFLILSLLSFSRFGNEERYGKLWYMSSLFWGFIAIFSKESAFALPLLIWLMSFIFNDNGNYRARAVRAIKYSIPFAGLVMLNTTLHVLLFGYWGVSVSRNTYEHIVAGTNSFFNLIGPLRLLEIGMTAKIVIFSVIFLIIFIYIIMRLLKSGISGTLDTITSSKWKNYTYLLSLILIYMAIFTVSGKSLDFYQYVPSMALSILIVMFLLDTFSTRVFPLFVKLLSTALIIYTIVYSPLFTKYTSWRNSSEITRQTIGETTAALNSEMNASKIYLINWPSWIGLKTKLPAQKATILVSYSMDSWLKWSGLLSNRDIEFIHISGSYFPPGEIDARFDYTFTNKKIAVQVRGCYISASKITNNGNLPFELMIKDDKKNAELVFTRGLKANERLFLYDLKGIKVVGNEHKPDMAEREHGQKI